MSCGESDIMTLIVVPVLGMVASMLFTPLFVVILVVGYNRYIIYYLLLKLIIQGDNAPTCYSIAM